MLSKSKIVTLVSLMLVIVANALVYFTFPFKLAIM